MRKKKIKKSTLETKVSYHYLNSTKESCSNVKSYSFEEYKFSLPSFSCHCSQRQQFLRYKSFISWKAVEVMRSGRCNKVLFMLQQFLRHVSKQSITLTFIVGWFAPIHGIQLLRVEHHYWLRIWHCRRSHRRWREWLSWKH